MPVFRFASLARMAKAVQALAAAAEIDQVARLVLADLLAIDGVHRAGIALTEGGGRRLRFAAAADVPTDAGTDRGADSGTDSEAVDWCHIDAFDDVPLTTVVRTGEPIASSIADLDERYAALKEREAERGSHALASVALPGTGAAIGGLVVFYDQPHDGDLTALDRAAEAAAEAIHRIRSHRHRSQAHELSEVEDDADAGSLSAATKLPDDARAPGLARRFVRQELHEWGVDDEVTESAQLCVSEVNHAHTSSDLRISLLDGVLTILVRDRGRQVTAGEPPEVLEPPTVEDPLAVHGRGLMLVEALADRWGSERDARGTTVWFAIDHTADEPQAS